MCAVRVHTRGDSSCMNHSIKGNVDICYCCWKVAMVTTPVGCLMQSHNTSIYRMYAERRSAAKMCGLDVHSYCTQRQSLGHS